MYYTQYKSVTIIIATGAVALVLLVTIFLSLL